MSPAIRIQGLSKRYRLDGRAAGSYRTLREAVVEGAYAAFRPFRRGFGTVAKEDSAEFWALKNVEFEVQPGEVVGVIGRNGAGKSTLLKIISRITEPTAGKIELKGRVGSLLEVGTGFHPELTGRENIFLNGSILGMTRREIARHFDEIVAFAEVENFLDTPVKRYSSGMYVRLAFAVAAHLQPEILIVDEVLAVGDATFQKKCLGKMRDAGRSGRTVLFVSHNLMALESLCDRCVLLERGQIRALDETRTILSLYHGLDESDGRGTANLMQHSGRVNGMPTLMNRASLIGDSREPTGLVQMGSSMEIRVDYDPACKSIHPVLGVVVKTDLGGALFGVNNRFIPGFKFEAIRHPATISCHFDRLPLMPGRYLIDLYLGDERNDLDIVHEAIGFEVVASDVFASGRIPPRAAGPIYWPATWKIG